MQQKYPLFFFVMMLIQVCALAQPSVSGRVVDASREGIPFANIVLMTPNDSSIVTGAVTSLTGSFHIPEVKPGDYILSASMIGYKSVRTAITVSEHSGAVVPNDFLLEEASEQLQEVVVKAIRPAVENHGDKLVVNVENSIALAGSSALDVLAWSPGVSVNKQTNEVTLSGKEGVTIMINGKASRVPQSAIIQMLNGMNSSSIQKIEILTMPPAGFDAEGNGGIINIILKANEEFGTQGSVTLTAGYGYAEKTGASVQLSRYTHNFSLFADASFLRDATHQFLNNRRTSLSGDYSTVSRSERFPVQLNKNLRLGGTYRANANTSIGVSLGGYNNKWEMNAENKIESDFPGFPEKLIIDNHEINQWKHAMANVNLTHRINERQQISADVDYLYYHDHNPTNYLNRSGATEIFSEHVRSTKKTPIRFVVSKVDYALKLNESSTIDLGVKGTYSDFKNYVVVESQNEEEWVKDPELTSTYFLDEQINAAYASFTTETPGGLRIRSGLRYEYTITQLKAADGNRLINRNYGKLFPSLLVSRQLGNDRAWQLSYNRRITRPTFNDMAPFVLFVDPQTFFSGNTALWPSVSDAVQLQFSQHDMLFSLQYSYEDRAIANFQVDIEPEHKRQIFAAENLKRRETFTAMVTLPLRVTSWWQMDNTLIGFYQQVTSNRPVQERNFYQWVYKHTLSQRFDLPRNFAFELSGYYNSPSLMGISPRMAYGEVQAGVQKTLERDKGVLKLSFSDIFWTNKWAFQSTLKEEMLHIQGSYYAEPRVVRLSYTRKFGSARSGSVKKRSGASEEEQRRVVN